jgi:hypothetical protein
MYLDCGKIRRTLKCLSLNARFGTPQGFSPHPLPSALFFFQTAENRLHSYGMPEEGGVFFYRAMHLYEMHATQKFHVIKRSMLQISIIPHSIENHFVMLMGLAKLGKTDIPLKNTFMDRTTIYTKARIPLGMRLSVETQSPHTPPHSVGMQPICNQIYNQNLSEMANTFTQIHIQTIFAISPPLFSSSKRQKTGCI